MRKIYLLIIGAIIFTSSIFVYNPLAQAKVSLDDVKSTTCDRSSGRTGKDIKKRKTELEAKADKSQQEKDELKSLNETYFKDGESPTDTTCYDHAGSLSGTIRAIVNVLLFIVGAAAVIMLVVGGLKYVTSNGDQQAVKSAKDTVLYAIIGIIVAFLAYAIVNFVISQLNEGAKTVVDCSGKSFGEISTIKNGDSEKCKPKPPAEREEIDCKDLNPEQKELIRYAGAQKCK